MRIEKALKQTLPQQINLDLNPVITEPSKPKAYMDYPYEEKVRLLDSIRAKQGTAEPLTPEEKAFKEADRIYFNDDQPSHKY
jgi:hypothetical protein